MLNVVKRVSEANEDNGRYQSGGYNYLVEFAKLIDFCSVDKISKECQGQVLRQVIIPGEDEAIAVKELDHLGGDLSKYLKKQLGSQKLDVSSFASQYPGSFLDTVQKVSQGISEVGCSVEVEADATAADPCASMLPNGAVVVSIKKGCCSIM